MKCVKMIKGKKFPHAMSCFPSLPKYMEKHMCQFAKKHTFDFMKWGIIIAIASGCSATIKAGWSWS